ncbi:MAG: ROK family protein [Actinomycetota bacterium]
MMPSPVVLGLDFGGTKIAVAVCDLFGARIADTVIASGADISAETALARAVAAGHELLGTAAPDRELVAVGATTFGIPYEDRVELAPAIPGWDRLAFGRELRAAFPGARLATATDVKAAAAAEYRWGALAGCDPAIYLNLGTGLAAAVVCGGTVINGAHGAAGEIAYNLRSDADVGRPSADRRTLEDAVSGRGLAAVTSEKFGRRLTGAEVFELAETQPAADRIVTVFLDELAQHLVNLAIAIDPVRIAVGGGMVRSWARIGPALRHALDAAVPYPPELVVADFPFDAPLIGALALGVEAASAVLGEGAFA